MINRFPEGPFSCCLFSRKLSLKPIWCFLILMEDKLYLNKPPEMVPLYSRVCKESGKQKVMLCVHLVVGSKRYCELWAAEPEPSCYYWLLRTPTWQFVGCSHLKTVVNRKKISWGAVPPRTCQTSCCEECLLKKLQLLDGFSSFSPHTLRNLLFLITIYSGPCKSVWQIYASRMPKKCENGWMTRLLQKMKTFLDPDSTRYQKDGKML